MGGSQKQYSTQTYSPHAMKQFEDVISGAQQIAGSTNYNPATAMRVAGLSPYQTQGFAGIAGMQGKYDPYMQQALGTVSQVSQGIGESDINRYMSPYTQRVIDATMAQARQQQGAQLENVIGNQIAQNAQGGDRAMLQKALTEGQFALANNQTIAGLEQAGYSQAVQTALANNAQQLQGAYGLGNLAQAGQGMDMSQLSALIGAGAAMQGQTQAEYNAASQNAMQQTMWPLQMQQWLANIVGGIGALEGGTTTGGSKTSQQPGVLQWMGAIGAGAASMSDERLKENKREIGRTFDGQPIYSYNFKGDNTTHLGLLAQDVEKRHPEAVGEYNGWKTVDYAAATEDSAERGRLHDRKNFANGGFADGGFPSGGGNDPWASLLGKQQSFQTPQQPSILHAPTGPIGGDTGQYQEQGKKTGENLKKGYENYQKNFGDLGASGGDSGGGGGGPKIPGMGDGPGGMKMPGGGLGGMGPGSGAKTASAPSAGGGSNAWQSFMDATFGAPGSASTAAAGESAAALTEGAAGAGEAAAAASGAGAGAGSAAAGAGTAAAGAGEAAAGAGAAAAGAAEGAGAAGAAGAEGIGSFFAALGSLFSDERLKENKKVIGRTFDGQPIYSYNFKGGKTTHLGLLAQKVEKKHPEAVGERDGWKTVNYAAATKDAANRGKFARGGSAFADGGAPGDIWDFAPHDEKFLWNPYAFKPLPGGGVDPRAAYDSMHMLDMPPMAKAQPSGPEPKGDFPPMAGAAPSAAEPKGEALPIAGMGRSSPSVNEPLPPMAGANITPETRPWTGNEPTPRGAEYGAQSLRRPSSMFGPAPSPDEVLATGQRQIDEAVKPAIDYVRGVFSGSTKATGEFATNVWNAIKSNIPNGNSLTPEEAAALRREIAARPNVLERMWPTIQSTLQTTAQGQQAAFQAAKEGAAALPGAAAGLMPKFLTPEEAAAERSRRAASSAFPTHEQLVGAQPVTSQPGFVQNSYEHLARMPGDVASAANRTLVEPVKEFAGNVYEAGAALPGRVAGALRPIPPVVEPVDRAEAAPPLPERGVQPAPGYQGKIEDEKSLGRTLYERIFPNLSGAERVNEPAAAPTETVIAKTPPPAETTVAKTLPPAGPSVPSDVQPTPVKSFRVDAGAPAGAAYPMMEPYTAGMPSPKAESAEAGAAGAPVPMTARLGLEGNLGSVSRDTGGMPSMGRFGIHAVAGENASSAANFYHDFGGGLGFTHSPADDPWGFARDWQRIAKENPDGLMQAENAWYDKYVSGAGEAHAIRAGVPRPVAEDPRVREYMGDRLIVHGQGITERSNTRYRQAWANVSPDAEDKPAEFLKQLTKLDKSHLYQDFPRYLAEYPDRRKGLENRIDSRYKGAIGEGLASQAEPEPSAQKKAGAKTAAELLPEERGQVGFIQKLLGGWNPLEPITGPGPSGPGTDLLGLSSDQRRNLMQFSLGLMQGPFMGQSAAGAGNAMQAMQQYGLQQSRLGLDQARLGLEAMKAPKFQAFHTVDPMTGAQQTSLFNVHTGEIVGPGSTPGVATSGGVPQIPPNVHGEQAMNYVPEQFRGELQSIVSGETPITTYRAGPQREMWMRLARQVDPEWSERKAQIRQTFRQGIVNQSSAEGKMAHSFNAATGHLNDALSLNDVLPDNPAALAAARGWMTEQFGNDPYRKVWKTMQLGLADEIAKIQGGGIGAESEKQRWLERLSPDQHRSDRAAGLAAAVRIMSSHLNDMDRTYRNVMGNWGTPYDFLGPEGRATMQRAAEKFGQYTGGKPVIPGEPSHIRSIGPRSESAAPAEPTSAAAPAQPPTISNGADYQKLPPGAVFIDGRDGKLKQKPKVAA